MHIALLFAEYVGCALIFGFLIGIERQFRHSPAGLRTNTLVAAGAAIFVMIETLTGVKDARVAAQIVSGIGFIGGGAILREGLNIRGVNTAATLWCSAAVGALCGTGMVIEGAIATAIILSANLLLRPLSYRFGGQFNMRNDVETHYSFQFMCRDADESRLRRVLVSAAIAAELMTKSIRGEAASESGRVYVKAVLVSPRKADHAIETVVEALCGDSGVSAVEWEVAQQAGLQHDG